MEFHGKNIIGFELSAEGAETFQGYNPREGQSFNGYFHEATTGEVDRALNLAELATASLRQLGAERMAKFLVTVREGILKLDEQLIEIADRETALGTDRLRGERDRTTNQIKLFADLISEGSWVDARIDTALPDRKPLPRPDIRRILQPIGPVAVFGASNFPLAFSVAGGDTIAALAARNPVVVKAHPAHPGTSELVGNAIQGAARACDMPEGTFSMVHSVGTATSVALVTHPHTKALAFTGSQRAGRALFDAATRRPEPIPVYAEMGSVNPVFLLPETLTTKAKDIAEGLYRSVVLGIGQFCTSPGLVFGAENKGFENFVTRLSELFHEGVPATMLNRSICKSFAERFKASSNIPGVTAQISARTAEVARTEGQPGLLVTDSETWLANKELHEEVFGPSTLVVRCASEREVLRCAQHLEGSLTATVHGTADELGQNNQLTDILSSKAGRLIFNGYPTGVEVNYAMHHGGPYPATTDAKFTSVGAASIYRFARPVCYQNFPEHLLPAELQDVNPRHVWRLVNGNLTRDAL